MNRAYLLITRLTMNSFAAIGSKTSVVDKYWIKIKNRGISKVSDGSPRYHKSN